MSAVTLVTSDKVQLAATHYPVPTPSPGISLFHMMPATKESWQAFAQVLQQAGIGALAIDLRGHGQSTGGPHGYKSYLPAQHQASIHDLQAAIAWQTREGHTPLYAAGASIGANLALQALTLERSLQKIILLSPGLNYRGIETLPLARRVLPHKSVFIIAAEDDRNVPGNAKETQQIYQVLNCQKKIRILPTGGHGTDILKAHPELQAEVIKWLKGR